jgi:hypothetical protein
VKKIEINFSYNFKKGILMCKLYFSDAVSQSGFTNLSASFVNDKNGSLIIRELLQNSYDSAIEEAKRKTAIVKFYIEKIKKEDIPSIKEYEEAIFYIEQNEKLSEQERDILNTIKEELNKDEIWAFYVIDNGIGFDKKRLTAILSDGISEKLDPSNASGSYGNGHFSVFSSSNLRYVLYAGKHNNKPLCSGEAMLRTFKKDGELKSQNGFLLKIICRLLKKMMYLSIKIYLKFWQISLIKLKREQLYALLDLIFLIIKKIS